VSVEGIVLAAGASSRMGAPKALLAWSGESFLALACRRLREGGVARTIVVVGPPHGELVGAAATALPEVTVVANPRPEEGQLSSLVCALGVVGANAALVALVDHPAVRASTVRAVLAAHAQGAGPIVQPRSGGRGGHPVLVARSLFAEILAAPVEGGLRAIVKRDPARVAIVEVDDPGIYTDIDDLGTYAALVRGVPPTD